jgi:hypothetical protein
MYVIPRSRHRRRTLSGSKTTPSDLSFSARAGFRRRGPDYISKRKWPEHAVTSAVDPNGSTGEKNGSSPVGVNVSPTVKRQADTNGLAELSLREPPLLAELPDDLAQFNLIRPIQSLNSLPGA